MNDETKKSLDAIVEWVKKETPEKIAKSYMGLLAQYTSLKERLENFELKERVNELEDKLSALQSTVSSIKNKDGVENDTQ
jgi:polyhydroxyalkanoate synthesis regulator phasin